MQLNLDDTFHKMSQQVGLNHVRDIPTRKLRSRQHDAVGSDLRQLANQRYTNSPPLPNARRRNAQSPADEPRVDVLNVEPKREQQN